MKEIKINVDTLKILKETAKGYLKFVEENYKEPISSDMRDILDKIEKAVEEAEGILQ